MSMPNKSVTVIGAGVAGLTVAAALAERGAHVTVFDKGERIGATSCSWYAGGMLAPYCERESAEEAVVTLGMGAADWWDQRTRCVIKNGSLVVAQPRDTADLTRFARRTEAFHWVDGDTVSKLEPSLEGRFKKALYFPTEAHLNPRDALKDLADYIVKLGVTLHFNTDGYAARRDDCVVDTTGLQARSQLKDLRGVKGEMLIIKSDDVTLSRPVRMLHPRIPLYIVPRADGHFMVGATMIESAERGRITARSMIELLSAAYALHPAFGEAEIVEIGTDVRPAFPDNLPRVIRQDGIFHVNGLYRHGFLLAPAMAEKAAEDILEIAKPIETIKPEEIRDEAHRERATA